jgi:Protein of unknown function (DUF1360)
VHPVLLYVALVLTAFRLTWLVTRDTFPPVQKPRDRIVKTTSFTRWEWIGDLLSCHWCASGWLSLGVVLLADVWLSVPAPALAWGVAWAGAAIIAEVLSWRGE